METPPVVSCACKVMRCPVCQRCSRCGCSHDGESISSKTARKQGQPKRNHRKKLHMTEEDIMTPQHATRENNMTFFSPPPLTPQLLLPPILPEVLQMMRDVGMSDSKISSYRKNCGTPTERASSSLWDTTRTDHSKREKKIQSVVVNVYLRLLECISRSVCGEGADRSLDFFKAWLGVDKAATTAAVHEARGQSIIPAARAMAQTKIGSLDHRVVRSILCSSYPVQVITDVAKDVPGFSLSRSSYARGREEFAVLLHDGTLERETGSRIKYDPMAVDDAIKSVLSRDNVSYLSWGTKRIKYDGRAVDVPSIKRRRPISVMFDAYIKSKPRSQVSGRSYYRICNVMTHGEVEARKAVDYVTGFLINDNFDLLSRIVADILPSDASSLQAQLQVLKDWLKHGTFSEATAFLLDRTQTVVALCPRHDLKFGLSTVEPAEEEKRAITCGPCLQMHKLLSYISERLEDNHAEPQTLLVVNECYHKLDLFLGHRVRVVNQQHAIAQLFQEMKEQCVVNGCSNEALVVIDFKMKMDPIYFREKTVDHYGKRGMSWHGAMVRFWSLEDTQEGNRLEPFETKMYLDHITSTDNKQDKYAVLALVEAVILSIKRDLPDIRTITVQSDNASAYQNALVTLILPLIGAANGIKVSRYLHTETQDGKSVLDAHFARSTEKVRSWVKQEHNAATPTQLVAALTSDGGVPNSAVQLVDFNRTAVEEIGLMASKVASKFTRIVGRVNDVLYDMPPTFSQRIDEMPSYRVKAYHYSGMNPCFEMDINISAGTCQRVNPHLTTLEESVLDCNDEEAVEADQDDIDDLNESVSLENCDGEDHNTDEHDIDEEDEMINELIFPDHTTGPITSIRISTAAQIRRRQRKWVTRGVNLTTLPSSNATVHHSLRKDIVSRAKKALIDMHAADQLEVFASSTLPDQMMTICTDLPPILGRAPIPIVCSGWAQRQQRGETYGARYINSYREDVKEMFDLGENNESAKMGPAKMLESLRARYPRRYNMPSENDIRAEISKLTRRKQTYIQPVTISTDQAASSMQGNEAHAGPPSKRQKTTIAPILSAFIENLVVQNPSSKPKSLLKTVRQAFPEPEQTDSSIYNRIQYLRRKHKNHPNQAVP